MSDQVLEKLGEVAITQAKILANQDNQQKILDKCTELLEEHSKILVRNTVTVEDHHKRSLHLENRQDEVEDRMEAIETSAKVEEGKRSYLKELAGTIGIWATAITAVSGVLYGLYELAQKLGL